MANELDKFKKDSNFLKRELVIIDKMMMAVQRAADDWYALEKERKDPYDPYSFYAVMLDVVCTEAMLEYRARNKDIPDDFYKKMSSLFVSAINAKTPYWKSKHYNECNA